MRACSELRTSNEERGAKKNKSDCRAEIARGKEFVGSIVRVCLSSAKSGPLISFFKAVVAMIQSRDLALELVSSGDRVRRDVSCDGESRE